MSDNVIKEMETKRAQVETIQQQAWTDIVSFENDIERIIDNGPDGSSFSNLRRDTMIITKCLLLVSAGIKQQRTDVQLEEAKRIHDE